MKNKDIKYLKRGEGNTLANTKRINCNTFFFNVPGPDGKIIDLIVAKGFDKPGNKKMDFYANPIGEGGFGKVKLALNRKGKYFVVKTFFQNAYSSTDDFNKYTKIEADAITALHGFCVRFKRTDDNSKKTPCQKSKIYLIMKKFPGQNLEELNKKNLTIENKNQIAFNMIKEVGKLHKKGFIHNDIKPDNFIINANTNKAKLIDLGCAEHWINKPVIKKEIIGTYHFMHHSIDWTKTYSDKTDVYALGLTLFFIYTNTILNSDCSGYMAFKKKLPEQSLRRYISNYPSAWNKIPNAIQDLIVDILKDDLKGIPTINEVVERMKHFLSSAQQTLKRKQRANSASLQSDKKLRFS